MATTPNSLDSFIATRSDAGRPAPAEIVETVVVDHKPEGETSGAEVVDPELQGKSEARSQESQERKPKVREKISTLESDVARLRRENEELKKLQPIKPDAPSVPVNQQAKDWYADDNKDHPMPKAPDETKFDDYAKLQKANQDYLVALADWRAERTWAKKDFEKTQEAQKAAFESEAKEVGTQWQERLQASPVYEELMQLVGPEGEKKDIYLSQVMMDFMHTSPIGPELGLHLMKNEADYGRIVAMRHGGRQLRALMELEAQLSDKTPAKPKLVQQRLPKPPTVLSGDAPGSGAATSVQAQTREEFEAKRAAEVQGRRRA